MKLIDVGILLDTIDKTKESTRLGKSESTQGLIKICTDYFTDKDKLCVALNGEIYV